MIKSEAKVTLDETENGMIISIIPQLKAWQSVALGAWIIVWLMSGFLALLGAINQMKEGEATFYLVFAAFWAYFLFYALRSFIWNRIGTEYIELKGETCNYKRSWNGLGKVKSYALENMKNLGLVNYGDKVFARTYGDAFWTMGGEMIGFEFFGKKVVLGLKLSKRQAKDIVRTMEKRVRKERKGN